MAKIRIDRLADGQHPSEILVSVVTSSGSETLIVDRRSLDHDTIDVGFPVGQEDGYLLVELPRETMRGNWRVLVPKSQIVHGDGLA